MPVILFATVLLVLIGAQMYPQLEVQSIGPKGIIKDDNA
jgi:hypothetical protein